MIPPRLRPAVSCWSTGLWYPRGTGRGGTALFAGKHRDTGFSLQVAATLVGDLLAVSGPVPGSRHDIHAWRQSFFPEAFAERDSMADLGYVGSGMLTPRRKPLPAELP
ncbi:transposase family protein [Streptomyces sp. NPDC056534]|uniref:transposase family protein n=1 Tax=Streptomyces sp. NPDC056534 TaxID=3345857 RepID=UPI0036A700BF